MKKTTENMTNSIQDGFERCMRTGALLDGLIEFYSHLASEGRNGKGVEVGSHMGESAEVAAQFVAHLTCVDPWTPGFNGRPVFDARMAKFSNVTTIVEPSIQAAIHFADESLDFVYIDAMHDYENVKADILAWFPKVRLNGFITGHDYDDMDTHVDVVKAVNELLGTPEWRFSDSSWLFEKTPALATRIKERT